LYKFAVITLARSADDRLLLSVDENVTAFVHDLATDWHQELTSPGGILVAGCFLDSGQTILLQAKMPLLQATLLARYRRDPGSGEFALDGKPRRIEEVLGPGSLDPTTGRLLLGRPAAGGFLAVDPTGAEDDLVTTGPPCSRVIRSPDGALLATCLTSEIALWRSGAEHPFAVLPTDSSKTAQFAFSPNGRFLGVISKSGAVWMHSTADGKLLWSSRVPAIGWSLAFSEDGAYLLTGDSDCVVRHWLVDPAAQTELARRQLADWRWTAEEAVTLADNEVPLVLPSR
jgi:WD40 repeat protein